MLSAAARAPAFELPDLAGEPHALGQGRPALLVFWKASCGTCRVAFPYIERLRHAYPGDGWQLLAISQDDADTSAAFAQQQGLTLPVLIEGEGWPVSQQYDPDATPTLFLVGPDGLIEMTSIGFDKWDLNKIAERVAELLGEPSQKIAEEADGNPPLRPG
jgi:peroxiredoxin